MAIKKVGIFGQGTMGHGIAIVTAQAGYEVVVTEVSQELLDAGLAKIKKFFDRQAAKGRIEPDVAEKAVASIKGTLDLNDFADCDLVIEAIFENIDLKKETWEKINAVCKPECIFASNTSSLSVTEMGAASGRPDKFMGLHFFNPVPLMKLVEVISALQTDADVYEEVFEFANSLGKKPVRATDKPGFIVNRLLVPYLIDAARTYEQGLASKEDIDTAMKFGAGHPMGPLELIDLIGIDVAVWVGDVLFEEFGEERMMAPPMLRRMLKAGYLGRKSGKGYYDYGK